MSRALNVKTGISPDCLAIAGNDGAYWLRIVRICSAEARARSLAMLFLRRISLLKDPVGLWARAWCEA